MTCEVTAKTLQYLTDEGFIDSDNKVIDLNKDQIAKKGTLHEQINKLTELAEKKYGLITGGKTLLFTRKSIISDAEKIYTNDYLFNELQDKIDNYKPVKKRPEGITLDFSSAYDDNSYNLDILKDGVRVGAVNYALQNGVATVDAVEIDPAYRRQGIASEVYEQLATGFRKNNVVLRSGKLNENSTPLWNSLVKEGLAKQISADKYEYLNDVVMEEVPLVDINLDVINSARTKEVAEVLAQRLSQGLKVNYFNVSAEEAVNILKSTPKPYNGEPAFYYAGTVYVVGDNVNVRTVLHEFSHPLLGGIRKSNPKLLINLFNQLAMTDEGQTLLKHVQSEYPELDVNSDLFKEEVLAFALQLRATNRVNDEIESKGFEAFITKLLAAMKQFLRDIFGPKVNVKNLDVNTTLDELAEMLLEEDFEFATDMVSEDDLVMYGRFVTERADEFIKKTSPDSLQKAVNEVYAQNRILLNQARNFRADKPTYERLKQTLFKEGTTSLLPEVVSTLKGYQNIDTDNVLDTSAIIDNVLDAEEKRMIETKLKADALVNSLNKMDMSSDLIIKDLNKILSQSNINSRQIVSLVNLYKNTAYAWDSIIDEINNILSVDEIDTSSEFYRTLNKLKNNVSIIQTQIADIYKKNNVQFFVEATSYMNDFVIKQLNTDLKVALQKAYKPEDLQNVITGLVDKVTTQSLTTEDIETLAKDGVPVDKLNEFIKKYNDYIVDEDKITRALTGHAKDVSWFNRWLETYSSSNDIIAGPLANFIQNQKTEVETEVWHKSAKFQKKLEELLPKVNFSKLNSTQVRDMVAGIDTIMTYDKKTGKTTEKQIYTFLNEFGNGWRYQLDILEYNYDQAKESGDKEKIAQALSTLRQFNTDYMWQEYTPEYYEKDDIFKSSEAGNLAYLARKQALDKFNNLNNQFTKELDRFEHYGEIEAAYREYKQLYSSLYEDGTAKFDDPSKGIYDLSISKVLQQHRQATSGFYEFIPLEGSLETSYNQFIIGLKSLGIENGTAEFKKKYNEWLKQNVKVVYSDAYYEKRNQLFTRLAAIQSKMNETFKAEFDVSAAYKTISDLIYSYKDDFGQPDTNQLGVERLKKIKDLEQAIINFRNTVDSKSGLSKADTERLNSYIDKAKRKALSPEDAKDYALLLQKQKDSGIDPKLMAELDLLFGELRDMSNKVPTEYYLDAINMYLSKYNITEVNEDTVDDFINSVTFDELLEKDQNLADWFNLNHVKNTRYDKTEKDWINVYQRTAANSFTKPTEPDHFVKTYITDTETGEKIEIFGVPGSRHSRLEVKNKYRTIPRGEVRENYVGKYIDNKGNFLPRTFQPGVKNSAKDDKFMDKRYAALKASNSAEYQLLEAMKEHHLEMQKGQSTFGKLYLDVPRFAISKGDIYQALHRGTYGERYKEAWGSIKSMLKQQFGTSIVDFENDLNYNPENNLVNTDLRGDEVSYIPVTGLYNLDIKETDADIIQSMFKYALSLQTQGKLNESLPLVQSLLSTLEDPANQPKNLEKFSKGQFNVRNKLQNINKKGATNNRLGQVRSLIEREYYGVNVIGLEENYPRLGKWLNTLTKLSSGSALRLNIPSDLKNKYSGYIQTLIEGAGGEFITLKDIALATPWATKAMLEWTTKGIYQIGPGAVSTQLVQVFDPVFKMEDEFGKSITRSLYKDLVNGEWMFMHRKFGEMEVAMKLFGSFLHGQKIDMVGADGKSTLIRYADAWEKDAEGILQLRKGIHPGWDYKSIYHTYTKGESLQDIADRYGITLKELQAKNHIKVVEQLEDGQELVIAKSENFKLFKNKLQGTSRRLFGVYDKFGQPEGNKYIMYRMFFFMRKWFTPMFANRFGMDVSKENFGGDRYDWALGKTTKGFYISAFQTMWGILKSKGANYQYMTDQEKSDFRRFAAEGMMIVFTSLLASMLFGYKDDDDDKWKKVKARSGAFGTDEYNTYGFLANHALLLLLGLQAETGAFVPLPKVFGLNLGADDYAKMLTSTTTAFGNTLLLYTEILGDVLNVLTFNEAARFKKETGPYWWQQKGELKIWKRLFSAVGFTAGTGDPESVLKNLSKGAGRVR
jgi:LysM repeat protein/predicted GNAT family acetyltransferase/ribosomal protein L18E